MAKRVPVSAATKEYEKISGKMARFLAHSRGADTVADRRAVDTASLTIPPGSDSSFAEMMQHVVANEYFLSPEDVVWINRWSGCKQVYRIDSQVAEQLREQRMEGDLPVDSLRRLPYPIIYVDSPVETFNGIVRSKALGFLAWLDVPAENVSAPKQLMICYLFSDRKRLAMPIKLTGGTLHATVQRLARDTERAAERIIESIGGNARVAYPSTKESEECVAQALNLLLYVISAEEDSEIVYRPPSGKRGQRAGKRTNLETHHEIGARMGRAIGAAKAVAFSSVKGDGTRTVTPHVRRAHWQHFWIGRRKGRDDGKFGDELVVRWIPPAFVNGNGDTIEVVHIG